MVAVNAGADQIEIKSGADGCRIGGAGRTRRPRQGDGVAVGVMAREDDMRTGASILMDVRLHDDLQQMDSLGFTTDRKTSELRSTRLN